MQTITLDPETLLAAARTLPADRPIFMLNMLRYRDRAVYDGHRDETPCSGREAYHQRYLPTFRRLAEGVDYKLKVFGSVSAKLVGPDGARWDEVAVVEYPNYDAFRAVVDTDRYRKEADPHRCAALEDFRLFVVSEPSAALA